MYLSKLELNPRSREARRDLALPYELHRTLAQAFATPDGEDYRAAHGVLFRIEPLAYPQARPVVLVQSATPPNWQGLLTDYLLREPLQKEFSSDFSVGQVLSFRLLANPTKKVKREGRRQGSRVALPDAGGSEDELTPAQQWLQRKGQLGGFEPLHVMSEGYYLNSARSPASALTQSTKQQLPLYGVRFDGLLRVSEPAAFASALQQGVGSAKAFGFGLLSVARNT